MAMRYEGWDVTTADSGVHAVREAKATRPDVIVLDMMLPDFDGLEVMRRIRMDQPNVPVIFLTAKDAVGDRIAGLTAGGDDYVTKPFSHRELVARIRAVTRRGGPEIEVSPDVLEENGVRMDVERHEVSVDGKTVRLALKEFDLLEVLLRNAGRVMTRASLIDRVWGVDYVGDTKTLDVHVKRLRAKIEKDPSHPARIITVRGLGYKFQA